LLSSDGASFTVKWERPTPQVPSPSAR